MENAIRAFALNLGVDDIGFADSLAYNSPKSNEITKLLPDAKSIIVLAFRVLSSCESPSWTAALNGYMDLGAFARTVSYRLARYLEAQYGAKVANIPLSFPIEIRYDRRGVADFSHRHAAIVAGLGIFGRHNLVVHPRFGTRVNFVSIITNLALAPSPKIEQDCCIHCNLCVENCPGGALNVEGKTDVMKCLSQSQPYGLGAQIDFWNNFIDSPPEAQKDLVRSELFARLRQSAHLGNQYMCFNCMKSCPVGV